MIPLRTGVSAQDSAWVVHLLVPPAERCPWAALLLPPLFVRPQWVVPLADRWQRVVLPIAQLVGRFRLRVVLPIGRLVDHSQWVVLVLGPPVRRSQQVVLPIAL